MGMLEAIYVDIKKSASKAYGVVCAIIFIGIMAFLIANALVLGTAPIAFAILFLIFESATIAMLLSGKFQACGVCALITIGLLCIAIHMSDSPWSSGRQPIAYVVAKVGGRPKVKLLKPRVLTQNVDGDWSPQLFALGMQKPNNNKNVILLGGFKVYDQVPEGFFGSRDVITDVNLRDVRRIERITSAWIYERKKVTLNNGTNIEGKCLSFVNFWFTDHGKVWVEGKAENGKKVKVYFKDIINKGDYIEFFWEQ